MTYTKQEWIDGETVISAERMDHIESGIEDAHDAATEAAARLDAVEAVQSASPFVQAGTVVVTVTANTNSTAEVTFPQKFASPPTVVVAPETGVPDKVPGLGVSAITTTGCTVTMYRTTSTDTSVHWIAVGA